MTAVNTASSQALTTALFCRIDVPDYAVIRVSDYIYTQTIDGETYDPLGRLLSISAGTNDLRAPPAELTVTLSGIPNASIAEFVDNRIGGSEIQVWRKLYNAATGVDIGTPIGRFQGLVNNFAIEEDYDIAGSNSTVTILITATSEMEILGNKVSGRRTNPIDQKALFATDQCFDRVQRLTASNLNWGAPA